MWGQNLEKNGWKSLKRFWNSRWIAVSGIALMAVGIWRGDLSVILQKAVHICLECIGIG